MWKFGVDAHLHTHFSGGYYSEKEFFQMCAKLDPILSLVESHCTLNNLLTQFANPNHSLSWLLNLYFVFTSPLSFKIKIDLIPMKSLRIEVFITNVSREYFLLFMRSNLQDPWKFCHRTGICPDSVPLLETGLMLAIFSQYRYKLQTCYTQWGTGLV